MRPRTNPPTAATNGKCTKRKRNPSHSSVGCRRTPVREPPTISARRGRGTGPGRGWRAGSAGMSTNRAPRSVRVRGIQSSTLRSTDSPSSAHHVQSSRALCPGLHDGGASSVSCSLRKPSTAANHTKRDVRKTGGVTCACSRDEPLHGLFGTAMRFPPLGAACRSSNVRFSSRRRHGMTAGFEQVRRRRIGEQLGPAPRATPDAWTEPFPRDRRRFAREHQPPARTVAGRVVERGRATSSFLVVGAGTPSTGGRRVPRQPRRTAPPFPPGRTSSTASVHACSPALRPRGRTSGAVGRSPRLRPELSRPARAPPPRRPGRSRRATRRHPRRRRRAHQTDRPPPPRIATVSTPRRSSARSTPRPAGSTPAALGPSAAHPFDGVRQVPPGT